MKFFSQWSSLQVNGFTAVCKILCALTTEQHVSGSSNDHYAHLGTYHCRVEQMSCRKRHSDTVARQCVSVHASLDCLVERISVRRSAPCRRMASRRCEHGCGCRGVSFGRKPFRNLQHRTDTVSSPCSSLRSPMVYSWLSVVAPPVLSWPGWPS